MKCRILFIIFVSIFSIHLYAADVLQKQPADSNTLTALTGKWNCVAYVESIEEFAAEQEVPTDMLLLKSLELKGSHEAVWLFGEGNSQTRQWDTEKIISLLGVPASYEVKKFDEVSYLFVEWISNDVTILNRTPCYYVFKKSTDSNHTASSVSDPVGKWTVVDFVRDIKQFNPRQQNMTGPFTLKNLYFLKSGVVWWIYKDDFRRKKTWSGNTVDYEPSYPAHFIIQSFGDDDYLFIEWISGDVTERGQKPYYYVLKKVG